MPSTDATAPMASIWPQLGAALARGPRSPPPPSAPLLRTHGGGILWERSDGRCAGRRAGARPLCGLRRAGGLSVQRAREAPVGARAVGAVVRRRDAEVAPERLRELGRLAVADAVRDLAHGQPAGWSSSSAAFSIRTRVRWSRNVVCADLGVGALELAARGRDAAGDLVEREVAAVLAGRRSRWPPRRGSCGVGSLWVVAWARSFLRGRIPERMIPQALRAQTGALRAHRVSACRRSARRPPARRPCRSPWRSRIRSASRCAGSPGVSEAE